MTSYNPFYDDVKSRKSEASGARHRVGGSKSKKCSLPSDNLTDAQKRKLNGPVRAYNVKTPMSWEEFKSMPTDLQQAHLTYIQDRFNVGAGTISTLVFGLSQSGLGYHMNTYGLELEPIRCQVSRSAKESLKKWVSGDDTAHEEETHVAETPALEDARVEFPTDPKPAFVVKSHSADISGSHNDLLLYIHSMLGGRSADVHIEIKFKEEN